jgi:hypothetical protein
VRTQCSISLPAAITMHADSNEHPCSARQEGYGGTLPWVTSESRARPSGSNDKPGGRYLEQIVLYCSQVQVERRKKGLLAKTPATENRHSFTVAKGYHYFLYTLSEYTITYFYVFQALPLLNPKKNSAHSLHG